MCELIADTAAFIEGLRKAENALMAIRATLKLEGGKELERKLKTLPTRVRNKVVRTALRNGAKIVQAETKALAPVETGLLRKSLKVRASKRKKGRIGINVQMGKGDYKGETFYGAFVEYGHKIGKRSRGLKRAEAQLSRWEGRNPLATARRGVLKRITRAQKAVKADPRKHVEGLHFMEQAFQNKATQAATTIEKELKTGTEREASRG